MSVGADSPALVYSPKSLAEALALFVPNPQARLFSGGTAWQTENLSTTIDLAPVTISLHLADDLRRISYGERNLDLGSGMTLNQLLLVRGPWFPAVVKEAAKVIGTSALRNLATLGGNLCQQTRFGDLFLPLAVSGAQFELRSLRGSRWVPAQVLVDLGRMPLNPGEILTRIRIPQEEWPQVFYEKIGNIRTPWEERMALVGLARGKDRQLESLRLAYHLPQAGIVRVREVEAELAGQGLPLAPRTRESVVQRFLSAVEGLPELPSAFQRDRIVHMTRWVLTHLDDD